MNPGSSVTSPRSSTRAPAGTAVSPPAATIRPLSTTTVGCGTSAPLAASNNRAALIATTSRSVPVCAAAVADPKRASRVLTQTDATIRRNFRFRGKSFSPRLDFFNLTNQSTITTRVTQLSSTYHIPSDIQRGRVIKMSISAEF